MKRVPDTPSTAGVATPEAGPDRLFRATLLAASSLTIMAAAIIAPSLPEMSRVYSDAPAADVLVRLCLTITSLAIGLTATVAGAVTDRWGRKPVLIFSLLLYALAGVGGYFASDLAVLLGARAVLGLAVGGIMSAVSAAIVDLFDGPSRARFLGFQQAAASAGGMAFLPLAGVLAEVAWNAPFWLYAAALLVVPLAVLGVRETHVPARGLTAPVARSRPSPGTPRGLVAMIFGLAGVGTLVFFMAPTQLPFLLRGLDVSPTVTGVVVAASTASGAVAATSYARVRRALGQGSITVLSLATLGAGWVVVGTAASLTQVILGVLVGGVGVGLVIPNLNLWLSDVVPATSRGRVLGGLVSAIFVGQFLSPLLLQPLVASVGLPAAFALSGGALVGGSAVLALVFRRTGVGARFDPAYRPSGVGDPR